jgi:hypothetical protein
MAEELIHDPPLEPLDLDVMMQRIAVQRSYFALTSLHVPADAAWDIYGQFSAEQPLGAETGIISTAEAGRHLAILGSCAAALSHSERIYYLAAHAIWSQYPTDDPPLSRKALIARAKVIDRTRNQVRVCTELLAGSTRLGSLTVQYHVMSEIAFQYQFLGNRAPTDGREIKARYSEPLELSFGPLTGNRIVSQSQSDAFSYCVGHFPNFPLWPVAVVMQGVTQTATRLLQLLFHDVVRFRVASAQVDAQILVPASEPLTFDASIDAVSETHCRLTCETRWHRQLVAGVNATLIVDGSSRFALI